MAELAARSTDVGAKVLAAGAVKALDASGVVGLSATGKTSAAKLIRHLALANSSGCFEAYPLAITLLNEGPDAAQENAAASMQAFAYNTALKARIVESPQLAEVQNE